MNHHDRTDNRHEPQPAPRGWLLVTRRRMRDHTQRLWEYLISESRATRSGIERIEREIKKMAANFAELTKDIRRLADGYVAQQAKIAALEAALAEADAVKAQAVADAIAADDAIDQAAIDEADAIVESVSPEPAPEEPTEDQPA